MEPKRRLDPITTGFLCAVIAGIAAILAIASCLEPLERHHFDGTTVPAGVPTAQDAAGVPTAQVPTAQDAAGVPTEQPPCRSCRCPHRAGPHRADSPLPTPHSWAASPLPTPVPYVIVPGTPPDVVVDGPFLTPDPDPYVSPKKGVAVSSGNQCTAQPSCSDVDTLAASWIFNWGTRFPYDNCDETETIGMVWGAWNFKNGCPNLQASSDWLLTFNEPELIGQADITPQAGALLYRQVENCFPDKLLVSPAVVRELHWLTAMRGEYEDLYGRPPRFDALGLHCYPLPGKSLVDTCLPLLEQMETWCREWDGCQGLIINEFGTSTHVPGWRSQMDTLMQRFETDPMVLKYAWYTTRERGTEWFATGVTQLMQCDGPGLLQPGVFYRNFRPRYPKAYLPIVTIGAPHLQAVASTALVGCTLPDAAGVPTVQPPAKSDAAGVPTVHDAAGTLSAAEAPTAQPEAVTTW